MKSQRVTQGIVYTVVRSNRKTYAVHILPGGEVELRVPSRMTNADMERIILAHRDWILKKQEKMKRTRKRAADLCEGDVLPFLGRHFTVKDSPDGRLYFADEFFYLPVENRGEALKEFYRKAAKEYLPDRLASFAKQMGLSYKGVKITSAQSRWGSCTGKQTINLSLRLMMLPTACIEYVLVHELCHLMHMDHSGAFWAAVSKTMPDYPERERAIKNALVLEF